MHLRNPVFYSIAASVIALIAQLARASLPIILFSSLLVPFRSFYVLDLSLALVSRTVKYPKKERLLIYKLPRYYPDINSKRSYYGNYSEIYKQN